MANNLKLTSIVIKPDELEQGREQLKQVLTQLLDSKTESHYISFQFGEREFWLKINAKQPQVFYCDKNHLALLGSLKSTLDSFFIDKLPKGQTYFSDLDHDQRIKNSESGINIYSQGSPQERLEKEPMRQAEKTATSRFGFFLAIKCNQKRQCLILSWMNQSKDHNRSKQGAVVLTSRINQLLPEETEGDGNCAFNAFILGLSRQSVIDRLDAGFFSYKRRSKYIFASFYSKHSKGTQYHFIMAYCQR